MSLGWASLACPWPVPSVSIVCPEPVPSPSINYKPPLHTTHIPPYLTAYERTYLPTFLPTYLSTWLPTCSPTPPALTVNASALLDLQNAAEYPHT